MQDAQAPSGATPSTQGSPPRQKPATLTFLQSFTAFRSQPTQPVPVAVQSPVRRKPLPADSPIVARFESGGHPLISSAALNKDNTNPSSLSQITSAEQSPLFTDEELFLPRNLDE
jgi:hypothetical protein